MKSITAWYDGACPLCMREIAAMRWLDWRKRIMFIDVSNDASACPLDRSLLLARFHVRDGETILSGAAAFAALWRTIPLLWPIGQAARISIVLRTLERLYLVFLKVRPRIQRSLTAR
jgi:predicted DCC family thiol-disulfide oxidoreductase YuxK